MNFSLTPQQNNLISDSLMFAKQIEADLAAGRIGRNSQTGATQDPNQAMGGSADPAGGQNTQMMMMNSMMMMMQMMMMQQFQQQQQSLMQQTPTPQGGHWTQWLNYSPYTQGQQFWM